MNHNDLPFETGPDFFHRQAKIHTWFWGTLTTITGLLSIALTIFAFYKGGICIGIGAFILTSLPVGAFAARALKTINEVSSMGFLIGLLGLVMYAFFILILALVVRACSNDKGVSVPANADKYMTRLSVINDAFREYWGNCSVVQKKFSKVAFSRQSLKEQQKQYRSLYEQGQLVLSEAQDIEHTYVLAKSSVEKQAQQYRGNSDIEASFLLFLEQLELGRLQTEKLITCVNLNNEAIDIILKLGDEYFKKGDFSDIQIQESMEKAFQKKFEALQMVKEVSDMTRRLKDIDDERLEIYNKLKGK